MFTDKQDWIWYNELRRKLDKTGTLYMFKQGVELITLSRYHFCQIRCKSVLLHCMRSLCLEDAKFLTCCMLLRWYLIIILILLIIINLQWTQHCRKKRQEETKHLRGKSTYMVLICTWCKNILLAHDLVRLFCFPLGLLQAYSGIFSQLAVLAVWYGVFGISGWAGQFSEWC